MYIWISCQQKLVSLWIFTQRYLIIIQRNLQNLKLIEWVFQELYIFLFLDRPPLYIYWITLPTKTHLAFVISQYSAPQFCTTILLCNSALKFCGVFLCRNSAILRRITKISTSTYKFLWLTILNYHLRWPPLVRVCACFTKLLQSLTV